jgi:NitT/TauT family transport system substrate-binding protein
VLHGRGGPDNNLGTTFESIKSITKPSQLAGKSIGAISTNSGNTLVIDAYLAEHGVNYRSVHFVATGVTDTLAALRSGSVQAAELVAPSSLELLNDGGHRLQGDIQSAVGTPVFACWTALHSWIAGHGAVAKRFIHALDQADAYYDAHPAASAQMIAKVNGLPASASMANVAFTFATALTGARVERWITLGHKYGLLTANLPLGKVFEPIR